MKRKNHRLLSMIIFMSALVLIALLLPVNTQEVQAARKVKSYKITYKLGGGKNNTKNVKSLKKGKSFTLKSPTRKGYIFKGWYEKGKKIRKIKGNKKHTLTAKWEKNKSVKKNIGITNMPINGAFVPEIENASGPLTAPVGEKSNGNGSKNIYMMTLDNKGETI